MARIILIVIWLALTVYALADWARTPEDQVPGRVPRLTWLILILVTAPTFSIGAVAWIVTRWVARAESRSRGEDPSSAPAFFDLLNQSFEERFSEASSHSGTSTKHSGAPDDDPDFLFRLQRDLQRQRSASAGKDHASPADSSATPGGPRGTNPPTGTEGLTGSDLPLDSSGRQSSNEVAFNQHEQDNDRDDGNDGNPEDVVP